MIRCLPHVQRYVVVVTFFASVVFTTRVKYAAPALPAGWRYLDLQVAEDYNLELRLSLRQSHVGKLQHVARQVSDPQSPSYGQYLSRAELRALTAPAFADIHAVQQWLKQAGLTFSRPGMAEVIVVYITVSHAKKLLNTSLQWVMSDETRHHKVLAGDYWLPAGVDEALAAVYGLHGLPLPSQPIRAAPTLAQVTPDVLASTYKISGVEPAGWKTNRQAVAEFQAQTQSPRDLSLFFSKYVTDAPASDAVVYKFVGDQNGTSPPFDVEPSLDLDYLMGVAPGVLTEFWSYKGQDFCNDLKKWTSDILDDANAPLVHSVSYGWQGELSTIGCPSAVVQDIETSFAKMAASGITIIFASGDSGAGADAPCEITSMHPGVAVQGRLVRNFSASHLYDCCAQGCTADGWTLLPGKASQNGTCLVYNDVTSTIPAPGATSGGKKVPPKPPLKLYPSWPASSPWVTAVGATRFIDHEVGKPEMASDSFGSGGGFSWMFDAFPEQQAAVKEYLTIAPGLPPKGSFPPQGRATPDVATLGEGFAIVINGVEKNVSGTSAAAPTFAAMVSLLNEARLQAGMPPMGFLNPFLYQHPAAFTDVLIGSNAFGRFSFTYYGFNCTKGWDPVTGLGTPRFDKLLSAAMAAGIPAKATPTLVV